MNNMHLSIITATHQRPQKLEQLSIPSLLKQTNQQFQWIVINDGACPQTRALIQQYQQQLSIHYLEIPHQGLIAARNLGLDQVSSDFITFLDDDNSLAPSFVDDMLAFFAQNPSTPMCIPVRRQRRDIYQEDQCIQKGKEFLRPALDATCKDFVQNSPKAWFDSNGFTHKKQDNLRFNPNTLIMSDYEYLLQCFSLWGEDALTILPKELVLYVQTNQGIIGQSNFYDWLKDFEFIQQHCHLYSIFQLISPEPWLTEQIQTLQTKVANNSPLPGFVKK